MREMSIRPPFSVLVANPSLQAAAGAAVLVGLPLGQVALTMASAAPSSAGALTMYALNLAGFAVNCSTVSVPGRLDGIQDASMRKGNLNPDWKETSKEGKESLDLYMKARELSLVSPSGWAFTIWGPIYLGEAVFCLSQFLPAADLTYTVLPHVTAPFVTANLFQSLWCASFRPEAFNGTWTTFISPAMLAGTAYALSHVNAYAAGSALMVPLTMHFGWTTAATLVNLNSSLVALHGSERWATAAGHASAVLAGALGVGVTLAHATPAYGLTVAWALTACGTGMANRTNPTLASKVQKYLCFAGAAACAATSVSILLKK